MKLADPMDNWSRSGDVAFTRWLFRAYLAVLFLLPFPLASNRPLYWSLAVAALALLGLGWALAWLFGRVHRPAGLRRARFPLLTLLVFAAWSALAQLPPGWWPADRVPGFLARAYELAGAPARAVADPGGAHDALLLTLGITLVASLTPLLAQSRRRVRQVLATLVLAGVVQAVYGTFMVLSGVEFGFLEAKQFGRGLATGTFVNRNHFANLMMLALAAGLGLLLSGMDRARSRSLRQSIAAGLRTLMGPRAWLRAGLVAMVIALVLTRSRMGNFAFFAALTGVGMLALLRTRFRHRGLVLLVGSVLLVDILVVGSWFGVDQVVERIQATAQREGGEWVVQGGNRISANRESLDIIAQAPVAGLGGESFHTVYPAWRGEDQKFMDHAHNDYLEFIIEHGWVGAGLLALFVLLCFARALACLRDPRRALAFGVGFAALTAISGMLIHALVDFSLHIPANAFWFVVLAILPCAVRLRTEKPAESNRKN